MADIKPLVLNALGEPSQMKPGDTLSVANSGTGANTASGARTNLGLAIGTNVQAYSNSLDAIAAIASNGITVRTGAGAYASRSVIQPTSGITVTNGDGVAGNITLALSNDLLALENLSGSGFAVRTTADTWNQRSIVGTATRISVTGGDGVSGNPTIDLVTVADSGTGALLKITKDSYGRVTGTVAPVTTDFAALLDPAYVRKDGTTMTGDLILAGDPTLPLGAATKQYVEAFSQGQRDKPSVSALVDSNINISNPGTAIFDGVTVTSGKRILLVGQSTASQNGPWIFNGSSSALTRPTDFDTSAKIQVGSTFFIDAGTVYDNGNWTLISSGPYVLGTTALTFTQTNALGQISNGNGLTKTGNTLAVALSVRLTFNGNLIDLATTGVTAGTYTKYTTDVYGRVVGTGSATAADVGAQPVSAELTALAALAATGFAVRTNTGAYSVRTLTAPAAGITISNPTGVAGNPVFALANDLAALEGLTSAGVAVRTGTDTWTLRDITGVAGRTVVTNSNGVGGNINVDLDVVTGLVAGTYNAANVTVDVYGRVTGIVASSASGQSNNTTGTNNEASTIAKLSAVYSDGSGTFRKANANAEATSKPQGILAVATNVAAGGNMVTAGEVVGTTTEWDAITGQTGGLTINANYFLDNVTAGKITTSVPSSGFLVQMGRATSTTTLLVRIGQRIEL